VGIHSASLLLDGILVTLLSHGALLCFIYSVLDTTECPILVIYHSKYWNRIRKVPGNRVYVTCYLTCQYTHSRSPKSVVNQLTCIHWGNVLLHSSGQFSLWSCPSSIAVSDLAIYYVLYVYILYSFQKIKNFVQATERKSKIECGDEATAPNIS